MNFISTLSPAAGPAMRICSHQSPGAMKAASAALALMGCAVFTPAHAIDGCKVLLCLAAPDWRQIAQCVPTIQELFRDLRRGRPFPHCAMAGASTGGELQPAYAPGGCPPQYTIEESTDREPVYHCRYTGVIRVRVNGEPWTNVWWNFDGDSVSEYLPPAKSQLGTWNTRFDAEFDAWLRSRPPESPPTDSTGG